MASVEPLKTSFLIFTNGSSTIKTDTIIIQLPFIIKYIQGASAQQAKLLAVLTEFEKIWEPFNLYSDSQ